MRPDRKRLLWLIAALLLTFPVTLQADPAPDRAGDKAAQQQKLEEKIETLDKPLYSPFTERYLLDEVRSLNLRLERQRAEVAEKMASSQLRVSDLAMSYVTDAVTYFFYLITGITTLLVIIGWTSFREIRSKAEGMANKRISRLTEDYEKRLQHIEEELRQKSRRIAENHEEIEKTNEIHSLWLKASQEGQPEAKIAIYDQILMQRPDDVEAMTYKADAVLQLDEPFWALSLCNRALGHDPESANAYYQRACAKSSLGQLEEALADLEEACTRMEPYRDDAITDPAFENLRDMKGFQDIINKTQQYRDGS